MNLITLDQLLRSEEERNKLLGVAVERDDAWDALRTLADRHATLGPAQANFARQCLEAAGVPLTLTVREECGMKREGGDDPCQ